MTTANPAPAAPKPKAQPALAQPPAAGKPRVASFDPIKPPTDEDPFSLLLSGPPGSGKTWAASTFPEPGIFLADSNIGSIRKHHADFVGQVLIEDAAHFENHILPALERREYPCRTVVLDALSSILYMLSQSVAGDGNMPNNQQEWGQLRSRSQALTRRITNLTKEKGSHPGYYVIGICHEYLLTSDKGVLQRVRPDFPGSFKDNASGQFDLAFWCECKPSKRIPKVGPDGKPILGQWTFTPKRYVLHTQPDAYRETVKDGLSGKELADLPDELDNDFPSLLAAWRRKKTDSQPNNNNEGN